MINNPLLPSQTQESAITSFSSLINGIITILIIVGILIFIFFLIMGGINWISSGGDEKKVTAARSQITNAILGLIIIFAIFAILKLIGYMFGIPSLSSLLLSFPSLL